MINIKIDRNYNDGYDKRMTKNHFFPVLLILISCFCYSIMSVAVKITGDTLHPDSMNGVLIAFARFLTGSLLCLAGMFIQKDGFTISGLKDLLFRGFYGAISMTLLYAAIQINSSGRSALLCNTYPVFVAFFGYLFFKDKVRIIHWVSLAVCTVGVFFVFYDKSSYRLLGDFLALLSGISAGMAVHYISRASKNNNTFLVYLSACVFGLILTAGPAVSAASHWVTLPGWKTWAGLLTVGLLAFAGQIVMNIGFRSVSPVTGSIIGYSEILMTIFLSFFIGEVFKPGFIIGTLFIIFGLLITITGRNKNYT